MVSFLTSTLVLASYAILVSIFSGGITGVWVLGLTSAVYYTRTPLMP